MPEVLWPMVKRRIKRLSGVRLPELRDHIRVRSPLASSVSVLCSNGETPLPLMRQASLGCSAVATLCIPGPKIGHATTNDGNGYIRVQI